MAAQRVAVIGAGIAGLAAAWRLRQLGREVVLLEAEAEVGGRCRAQLWHGRWLALGAYAFLGSETNLVEQARALGIWGDEHVADLTHLHRWNVLVRRREVVRFEEFSVLDAARHPAIPLAEKARLLAALPAAAQQALRSDPRDITSCVDLDSHDACAWFRRLSPTFVNYFLEPCLALFCGYSEGDYSLGWTLWGASGRHAWANHWWSFRDGGPGRLTSALGDRLAADAGVELRTGHVVRHLAWRSDSVSLEAETTGGQHEAIHVAAAIVAVPGSRIAAMMGDLDEHRAAFFRQVRYSGHHLAYFLLDRPRGDLPESYVLPAADGFTRTASVRFTDLGDGRTLVGTAWKDAGCRAHAAEDDDGLLDLTWRDVVDVVPQVAGATVLDRFISRQPEAVCKRPAGFVAALRDFHALGPLPRVAFCGDWLSNSTIGQAHWTGLRAAEDMDRRLD